MPRIHSLAVAAVDLLDQGFQQLLQLWLQGVRQPGHVLLCLRNAAGLVLGQRTQ